MTSPIFHAQSSAKIWGGDPLEYLKVHDWFDQSKEHFADFRHRAMRHHAEGIFEAERVFGHAITLSTGRIVPVRYIGEQHVKEDCGGIIPNIASWLIAIKPAVWMSKGYRIEPAKEADVEKAADSNRNTQGAKRGIY